MLEQFGSRLGLVGSDGLKEKLSSRPNWYCGIRRQKELKSTTFWLRISKVNKSFLNNGFLADLRNRTPGLNLMAVFFDVLLVDDRSLLGESYEDRTAFLSRILTLEPGYAILPNRFPLSLKPLESAINSLQFAMSDAITRREEGLVLKPSKASYSGRHGWIKLKKDYIPGLGDALDFCVVGAGFDTARARDMKSSQGQKWNIWHIGCLENKPEVIEQVCVMLL